ncbi:MAG: rhomboid family intramembrane serine protease [Anaerolineae bacterium]|nr:rhomboid family intramembrane serine protease [Anaerolineae bacterium]
MKTNFRVHFNAPVVITLSGLAFLIHVLNETVFQEELTPGLFLIGPKFCFVDPFDYFRLVSYVLGHSDFDHLFSNLTLILLLGPILEERYGSLNMFKMIFISSLCIGIGNVIISSAGLLGASGIVYMFIVLVSIVDVRKKSLPLSFILVMLLFLGSEFVQIFGRDNVSQLGHIAGGVFGTIFGLSLKPVQTSLSKNGSNTEWKSSTERDGLHSQSADIRTSFLDPDHKLVRSVSYLFKHFVFLVAILGCCAGSAVVFQLMSGVENGAPNEHEVPSVSTTQTTPILPTPSPSISTTQATPISLTPLPSVCTSFSVGERVRVDWPSAKIRRTPGYEGKTDADVCDYARIGDHFEIIGGPEYVDNLCWWKIPSSPCEEAGWIAETRRTGDIILSRP